VFERKYKFDTTNERYVRKLFDDDVLKEIFGSNEVCTPWLSNLDQFY
jgi:DNA-directed RNA polymerase II subunit RPB1